MCRRNGQILCVSRPVKAYRGTHVGVCWPARLVGEWLIFMCQPARLVGWGDTYGYRPHTHPPSASPESLPKHPTPSQAPQAFIGRLGRPGAPVAPGALLGLWKLQTP